MKSCIFCDIDGVIFPFDEWDKCLIPGHKPTLLPNTQDIIKQWHVEGHKIVLVTGRPASMRDATIKQLNDAGIVYDQVIMDCGSGPRYLINDVASKKGKKKAIAMNVVRNKGIGWYISLEKYRDDFSPE